MRHLIRVLTICFLYLSITSFSWKNTQANIPNYDNSSTVVCSASHNNEEVVITYKKSDVCGLNYLGSVTVTEKQWIHYNNKLKEQTRQELKKLASKKGGNIVFVDIRTTKAFGIFFTTTIDGFVYQK